MINLHRHAADLRQLSDLRKRIVHDVHYVQNRHDLIRVCGLRVA